MPRAILAGAVLLAAACASSSTAPSGTAPAGSDEGRALYAAKCAGCHALPDPKSHGDAAWEKEVNRMIDQKGAKIAAADRDRIVAWLKQVNGKD
jgi:cytochrome c5